VYLSMIGGGAPLLTEGIAGVVETGWDDLIAQFRLSRICLDMFGPLTVAIDAHGNSRYAELSQAARTKLPEIMEMLADRQKGTTGSSKGSLRPQSRGEWCGQDEYSRRAAAAAVRMKPWSLETSSAVAPSSFTNARSAGLVGSISNGTLASLA